MANHKHVLPARGVEGAFGPVAHEPPWSGHDEGGTRDGRKPLLPHLVDHHGQDPDAVYGRGVGENLAEHGRLHGGRLP